LVNTWYYVIVTYAKSSYLKIYINGSYENQVATNSGTLRSSEIWKLAIEASYSKIGEFGLYNRVLSAAEILSNFNTRKSLYGY
jgi:hypothetical protein